MPKLEFVGRSALAEYEPSSTQSVLVPDPQFSAHPVGHPPSLAGNLLIEGDNLDVLAALVPKYRGRVGCIYLDPPYNTGQSGWRYNDNLSQPQFERWFDATVGSEGKRASRHDKWCCMLLPRLRLLKLLLSPSGFVVASIGDEEVASLRFLMDEVFGREHYRNTLVVRRTDKNFAVRYINQGLRRLASGQEYVLVYAFGETARMNAVFRPPSAIRRNRGLWKAFWHFRHQQAKRYEVLGVFPEDGQWRWLKEQALEAVDNYQRYLRHAASLSLEDYWSQTGKALRFLRRLPAGRGKSQGVQYWIPPSEGVLRSSDWTDLLATGSLSSEGVRFENPKRMSFMKELLSLCSHDGDIILDCFAGSGTTGQAVLELNAERPEQRRFLLIQQPYDSSRHTNMADNLCEAVTAPRLRRAVERFGGAFTYVRSSSLKPSIRRRDVAS